MKHRQAIVIGIAALLIVVGTTAARVYAASTIVVPRDFPTIQAAVDAAAPGDTISVKAGTYTEEIVIGKDLNLRGAGVDATIIKSPATLTQFATDRTGDPFYAIVRVAQGAHVRISGLAISGLVPCGIVIGVAVVQAATLDFADSRVSDLLPATTTCAVTFSHGVHFGLPTRAQIDGVLGTTAFGRVSHVVVEGFLNTGLRAAGPFGVLPTSVTFADNIVTPGVPPYPANQLGISVWQNAVAQVTGNTISGGVCTIPFCGPDPINEIQASGVVCGFGGAATIASNHISGSDVGIYEGFSPSCKISQNTLKDNRYFGIVIQDGDGSTNDNTISGGQIGIGVVASEVDTTAVLRGDKIKNTSVAAVKEIECCGFTATASIQ